MKYPEHTYLNKIQAAKALVLGLVLLFTAGSVSAETIGECKSNIDIAKGDIYDLLFFGGNPQQTRDGLESKLEGAKTKLDQYKACDAYQKLIQAHDKVNSLRMPNAKGEVKVCGKDPDDDSQCDPTNPDALVMEFLNDTSDAIACVLKLDSTCAP